MDSSRRGLFVERTLAILKPDAANKADEIEDIILRLGFTILQVRSPSMDLDSVN